MKVILQVINRLDGRRTPHINTTTEIFANESKKTDELNKANYVIIIFEWSDDVENWQVSKCPMMTVESFINIFSKQEDEENE